MNNHYTNHFSSPVKEQDLRFKLEPCPMLLDEEDTGGFYCSVTHKRTGQVFVYQIDRDSFLNSGKDFKEHLKRENLVYPFVDDTDCYIKSPNQAMREERTLLWMKIVSGWLWLLTALLFLYVFFIEYFQAL